MIVVTGGIASGKKTYLAQRGFAADSVFDAGDPEASTASFEDAALVLHVEELVREGDISQDELAVLLSKDALTCTEVGSGVIPLTYEDRQFRERAGALSSSLARAASTVVRMACGIPMVLKTAPEAQK